MELSLLKLVARLCVIKDTNNPEYKEVMKEIRKLIQPKKERENEQQINRNSRKNF